MTRIVCVHSLTAHGVVGLKAFIAELGEAAVVVPSLLLTGPGNMAGCRRFDYDFAGMLDGALAAVGARNERAALFVGYLAHESQVATIEAAIERHAATIESVVVDPVCGDNDRAYVSPALIAAWPRLLARADWALPNATEITLLTGLELGAGAAALRERYSRLRLIVTGVSRENEIATLLYAEDGTLQEHNQPRIPGQFGGTGDLFAAVWMREFFLHGMSAAQAIATANATVLARLQARAP
jgi:pyridoxal/pyridoxine/pyridoxamine kinase